MDRFECREKKPGPDRFFFGILILDRCPKLSFVQSFWLSLEKEFEGLKDGQPNGPIWATHHPLTTTTGPKWRFLRNDPVFSWDFTSLNPTAFIKGITRKGSIHKFQQRKGGPLLLQVMFFGREVFLDLFGNDILIGQICFSKAVVDTWNLEPLPLFWGWKNPPKRRPFSSNQNRGHPGSRYLIYYTHKDPCK